ncbi:helix-turn-helix domain-containing protein [Amycolatopsis sp. NPDC005003]
MVYDDDTYDPPHHATSGSDRVVPKNLSQIPEQQRHRIVELVATKPRWTAEQIFDRMRDEGYRLQLDHVYAVLAVIGRTAR